MTDQEMTDQEIIEVVSAHKEGKTIQYRERRDRAWITYSHNDVLYWNFVCYEYRVKPEPITYYANVYPGETTFYSTLESANEHATDRRIRCAKLVEVLD
jgi:hypothetical protein